MGLWERLPHLIFKKFEGTPWLRRGMSHTKFGLFSYQSWTTISSNRDYSLKRHFQGSLVAMESWHRTQWNSLLKQLSLHIKRRGKNLVLARSHGNFYLMSESHKYAELIIKARKAQNMAGVWAGAQTGVTLPIPQAQLHWQWEPPAKISRLWH